MQKKIFNLALIALFALNLAVASFLLYKKDAFHVDEVFSYAHANSTRGAFFVKSIDSYYRTESEIAGRWFKASEFLDYLTASPNNAFTYRHITDNLKKDVHPPLFYLLLHTACSFAPKTLSKYHAGIINLIALALTLIALYKLSLLFFFNKNQALLATFLFGFSKAAFASVTFLRMYALQMLFTVLLVSETYRMLKEKHTPNKRFFFIMLYAALGMATQYSSIVFSGFITASAGLVLISQKDYACLKKYLAAMFASLVLFFALFPTATEALLFSQRGTEGQETARLLLSAEFLTNALTASVYRFFALVAENLLPLAQIPEICLTLAIDALSLYVFCRILSLLPQKIPLPVYALFILETLILLVLSPVLCLIILLAAWLIAALLKHKTAAIKKKLSSPTAFLVLSFAGMALFLSLFMPYMAEFDLRYFIPLFPLASLFAVAALYIFLAKINIPQKTAIASVIVAILCTLSPISFETNSAFALRLGDNAKHFMRRIKNNRVLTIQRPAEKFSFFERMYYTLDAKETIYVTNPCAPCFLDEIKNSHGAVLLILAQTQTEIFLNIPPPLESCPELLPYLSPLYKVKLGQRPYTAYEIR